MVYRGDLFFHWEFSISVDWLRLTQGIEDNLLFLKPTDCRSSPCLQNSSPAAPKTVFDLITGGCSLTMLTPKTNCLLWSWKTLFWFEWHYLQMPVSVFLRAAGTVSLWLLSSGASWERKKAQALLSLLSPSCVCEPGTLVPRAELSSFSCRLRRMSVCLLRQPSLAFLPLLLVQGMSWRMWNLLVEKNPGV